jgi:hypothetical protein
MNTIGLRGWDYSLKRFERAAAKGHLEAISILSLVEGVERKEAVLEKAFVNAEDPLGLYIAGEFLDFESPKRFDFMKQSAEGGCSWGQIQYSKYFLTGMTGFVEQNDRIYFEELETAAKQDNPSAMFWLGIRRTEEGKPEKAIEYHRAAAELGWEPSMLQLAQIFERGEGCEVDLSQAVVWSAQAGVNWSFGALICEAQNRMQSERGLEGDFNQLCFSLGWGLYWFVYGTLSWESRYSDPAQAFGNQCLDFYCNTIELQQKSIFYFLLFWNKTVGVKDVGALIGKMVWEERRSVWLNRLWN